MTNNVINLDKVRVAQKAEDEFKKTMVHLLKKYDVPNPKISPRLLDAIRCFKENK